MDSRDGNWQGFVGQIDKLANHVYISLRLTYQLSFIFEQSIQLSESKLRMH